MIEELEGSKRSADFAFSSGREVFGELTCAGLSTSLYLRDKDPFDTHNLPGRCLHGTLHDLKKVTLVDCLTTEGPGYAKGPAGSYHFARIFPHFVLLGEMHLDPVVSAISEFEFWIDDAGTAFYDFDAFGTSRDARPFIEDIVRANALGRPVPLGPHPQIAYFTGKLEIFSAETVIGRISAEHNPYGNFGGPSGVRLSNRISVRVTFSQPLAFRQMAVHTLSLLRFLQILIGRPQNLLKLRIRALADADVSDALQVYWSHQPKRDPALDSRRIHSAEVLVDAIRSPSEFTAVLSNWISREDEWRDARIRFSTCSSQPLFDVERLIGVANIFDILPESATPNRSPLTDELKLAKEECKKIFKALPDSPERQSILIALKKLGSSTLKHKIRHRAQPLLARIGQKLPELLKVADEAVECRNHYVHGATSEIDYNANFDCVIFLTSALEFIFGASDFLEAGWDIEAWREKGSSGSHPYGEFIDSYAANLRLLKELLPSRFDSQ
jgi:hypothetical protein